MDHECKQEDKIDQIAGDTRKIIVGLYGGLDSPNSGFIYKVTNDVNELKSIVKDFKKEKDDLKNLKKAVLISILSAVISFLSSLFILYIKIKLGV